MLARKSPVFPITKVIAEFFKDSSSGKFISNTLRSKWKEAVDTNVTGIVVFAAHIVEKFITRYEEDKNKDDWRPVSQASRHPYVCPLRTS